MSDMIRVGACDGGAQFLKILLNILAKLWTGWRRPAHYGSAAVSCVDLADILYIEMFDCRVLAHNSKAGLDFNGQLEQQFPDSFLHHLQRGGDQD